MTRLVVHRTDYGAFASYFERFNFDAEDPECSYRAIAEPKHLTQCPQSITVAACERRYHQKIYIITRRFQLYGS